MDEKPRKFGFLSLCGVVLLLQGCLGLNVTYTRKSEAIPEVPSLPVPIPQFMPMPPETDGTVRHSGYCRFLPDTEGIMDVYYPVTFVSPPNLSIWFAEAGNELIEEQFELFAQQSDRFRLRLRPGVRLPRRGISWTAQGVPLLPAATVTAKPENLSVPPRVALPVSPLKVETISTPMSGGTPEIPMTPVRP